jgi:dienelactone hydrolase
MRAEFCREVCIGFSSRKLSFTAFLLFVFVTLATLSANAATHTKRVLLDPLDNTKVKPIEQTIGGYWEYLPDGYDPNGSTTYPLMIFAHGAGETANCVNATGQNDATACTPAQWNTRLDKVLANGPPKLINAGTFPASFTVNGEVFRFIVISPQFNSWPYVRSTTRQLVDYLLAQGYKIDTTRIYATGLSMGGASTWYAAAGQETLAGGVVSNVGKILAAVVPVCGAEDGYPGSAAVVAAIGLPVWATHNNDDTTVSPINTKNWSKQINALNPAVAMRMTIWPTGGHNAWTQTYDPAYREDGKNVYEWMLQYRRTSPAAVTGADKTPAAYSFVNQPSVTPSQVVVSNPVTVSGLAAGDSVAISVYGGDQATNAFPFTEYSIGCTGTFTSATGTIANGQTVCLRHTAPSVPNITTKSWVRIGGVYSTFESTTPPPTLTVSKTGNGGGNVVSTPGGINCGGTCSATFTEGAQVTLNAVANTTSRFTGWSGACGGVAACTVTMNMAKSVTANFVIQSKPDFDGNGKSDILTQDANGALVGRLMNGAAISSTGSVLGASSWVVTHQADFDGDGKTDLLIRLPDGRIAVLLMNGTTVVAATQLVDAGSGYTAVATGDFNGDGKADIVLRNSDGSSAVLLMNGGSATSAGYVLPAGSPYSVSHTGDFNGDGKTDLVVRHTDGTTVVLIMNGIGATSAGLLLSAASPWTVMHAADFNGDGKSDLTIKNSDGSEAILLMNGTVVTSAALLLNAGSNYSITHTGDFDGDGKADVLLKNTDGSVVLLKMNGAAVASATFLFLAGSTTSVARVADYNGDGKSDILLKNADGSATVILMNGGAVTAAGNVWGAGTLQVVP